MSIERQAEQLIKILDGPNSCLRAKEIRFRTGARGSHIYSMVALKTYSVDDEGNEEKRWVYFEFDEMGLFSHVYLGNDGEKPDSSYNTAGTG